MRPTLLTLYTSGPSGRLTTGRGLTSRLHLVVRAPHDAAQSNTRSWRTASAALRSSAALDGALHESRCLQRTTSSRVRTGSWKEKTARYDRLQEEQAEAEAAAQRRARAASSAAGTPSARTRAGRLSSGSLQSSFWRPKRKASGDDAGDAAGESEPNYNASHDSGDAAAMPRQGVWNFLRGGKGGRFKTPLNPLHALKKKRDDPDLTHNADARATQRLLHVVDELRMRSKKNKKASVTMQLSDEQRKEILNQYVDTRWYSRLYYPFRNVTEKQIKWTRRVTIFASFLVSLVVFACLFYMYYEEMSVIIELTPEDRQDYLYMVNGMRYSDIFFFAQDVLKKEDPLNALPPAARYHVVIEACREKGWDTVDWEVEGRKRHPHSALEEMDVAHMMYWTAMMAGNMVTGGGGLFSSDRMDELLQVKARARDKAIADSFVEAGPDAPPEKRRRGFF